MTKVEITEFDPGTSRAVDISDIRDRGVWENSRHLGNWQDGHYTTLKLMDQANRAKS